MTKQLAALIQEFATDDGNCELVNVNFFVGDNGATVTQEQLITEAVYGLSQIKQGTAKQVLTVDDNNRQRTVEGFLLTGHELKEK